MINYLETFRKEEEKNLFKMLIDKKLLKKNNVESFVYALCEISESIEEIYGKIIPEILNYEKKTNDQLEGLISDLKTEFSHILYHIEDGKLYGLKYWEDNSSENE